MMKFILVIIIALAGATFVPIFGSSTYAYEIITGLLQSEGDAEEKSKSQKIESDRDDNLDFVSTPAAITFAIVASSPENAHSSESYSNLCRQPLSPPPDFPAV